MAIVRETPNLAKFNRAVNLPYQLRVEDFSLVMQDVYDFFFDVNSHLFGKGIKRLDEMLRPAAMSGLISDMISVSMARHSRVLVENRLCLESGGNWFWRLSERVEFCGGQAARSRVSSAIS